MRRNLLMKMKLKENTECEHYILMLHSILVMQITKVSHMVSKVLEALLNEELKRKK